MKPIFLLPCFLLGVLVGRAFWPAVKVTVPKPDVTIRWFQGDKEHKVGQGVPGVYGPMTKPQAEMTTRVKKAADEVLKSRKARSE